MNQRYFSIAACLLAILGVACGDNKPPGLSRGDTVPCHDAAVEDAGVEATPDVSIAPDAPVDLPSDGSCPAGLSPCGQGDDLRCYDLNRTNDHCGACGLTCDPGIACQAGECQQYRCRGGLTFKSLPPMNDMTFRQAGTALGDFDGDGILDLAGVPDAAGTMTLLYGAGDGTFRTPQAVDDSAVAWQTLAADLDGDALVDLVSLTSADLEAASLPPTSLSTLAVRRGTGNRNAPFDAPTIYPTGTGLVSAVLADFDADGRADLVTGVQAGFEFRRGQVGGHFASPAIIPARDDMVSPFTFPTVVASDWNGDGMLDLVYEARVSVPATSLHFRLGRGDGTFEAEVGCALAMGAIGDVDHDGRPDLISGGFLLLGLDTCNAKKNVALPDWPEAARSALADLDGDGNLDVIVDGKVTVRVGDGKGAFTRTVSLPGVGSGATHTGGFLFGDLNRDRRLDIVYTQKGSSSIFLNTCQ